jgi:hypothetical protein
MTRLLSPALLLCLALVLSAAGLPGKWHFVLDTEGGPREADAVIALDGDKVSGKWAEKTDIKGTFSDSQIDLSFPLVSEEAGEGVLTLKGKLDGDTLSGNWSFLTYSGSFRASRQP